MTGLRPVNQENTDRTHTIEYANNMTQTCFECRNVFLYDKTCNNDQAPSQEAHSLADIKNVKTTYRTCHNYSSYELETVENLNFHFCLSE